MADKIDWAYSHKKEAANFVKSFYKTSYDWRNQGNESYHNKWDRWERNFHNIYDPSIRAKKESWQSTMFIPYSVTNVEIITSALFKLLVGKRESLRFEPREMGDELQAELHSDILAYEMDMAGFTLEFNKCLKELGIFGSGFMKFYWSKIEENRRIMKEVRRGFVGTAESLMKGVMASPNEVVGFKEVNEPVLVEDRVRGECVHIRDIFLEPNSRNMDRLIHRQKNVTYGELVNLSNTKNRDGNPLVDKESVESLRRVKENDKFDEDLSTIQMELGNTDPTLERTDYDKKHTLFEYWGPIPRKWIDLKMPEETEAQRDKANEMVPGKVIVASGEYFISSEENPNPIPKPPFVKHDYIECGQTYGKGICQIIEGLQEMGNEITNLRIDNVLLTINKVMAVITKFLVDPNEIRSAPGTIIRLKGNEMNDAKNAIMPIEQQSVDIGSYRETAEIERQIQEATAANRVTSGSAGLVKDTNQTLGGMELLKQAAYDRFSVYAFLIGQKLRDDANWIMALSYQNSSPDRNREILGEVPIEVFPGKWMPRYKTYIPIPPHKIIKRYDLKIADIFGMENRAQKAQQLASYGLLAATIKRNFNTDPLLHRLGYFNELTKAEVDDILKPMEPTPMAMGQGIPSISKSGSSPTGEVAPMGAGPGMGQ